MKVTTQFNLSLSPEELTQIKDLAKQAGKSANRFIIDSALNNGIKPIERVQDLKTVLPVQTTKEQQKPAKQAKTWAGGHSKQDSAR